MARTFAGSRARFVVQGRKFAYAGGVSGEETVDLEPVDVMDMVEVLEYVPVGYRSNFTVNLFRVIGSSLKNQGIYPTQNNILTSGEVNASVEDKITDRVAYLFQRCRANTKNFDFSARSLVTETLSMFAIRVLDESQV